jgi:acyl-CoA synthetase (NDP forming)
MSHGIPADAAAPPRERARDLSALFAPRSVAVVGASDDDAKYGNWLAVQAIRMASTHEVHLVNRRGGEVLGRPTVRTLAGLGAPVDLVVLAVPAAGFESAVDEALAAGARALVGVTSGFAEAGAAGREVQDRVVARVRAAGAVLLGPNCLGIYDSTTGLTLASNAMPPGRVALLSQSGNVALELKNTLASHGHGFSRFVSLGNQADVDVADLVRDCAHHDGTDVIAVYCEDFGDGRAFVAAAAEAARAGRPVVLLTVGGSQASIRGALSHTGAMTSSSAVVDAACEAAAVYRVPGPRALVNVAVTLARFGPARGNRLGVLADGGGHASLGCDLAESAGLAVPAFAPALREEVAALLPTAVTVDNPVDVGSGSELDIGTFASVSQAVLGSTDVDSLLITGYFGGYEEYGPTMTRRELDTAQRLAEVAQAHDRPVVVHSMYPDGRAAAALRASGIPVLGSVDEAVECLGLVVARTAPRVPQPPRLAGSPVTAAGYWAARELLRGTGLSFPDGHAVHRSAAAGTGDAAAVEQVVAAARELGFPVVVKAMGLLHKSDAGGVVLDLGDEDGVRAAVAAMDARLRPPGYTVERMLDRGAGLELLIGTQRDPHFGTVVAVGMGGVYAEVLADVAVALGPVDEDTALGMLRRLRCAPILAEFRGRPRLALDAAAHVVSEISFLAAAHPEITELEVNPVLLTPTCLTGLDARIVLDTGQPQEDTRWTSA